MVLRNFLYLDQDMMEDYLATLEGYITEQREEEKIDKFTNGVEGNLIALKGDLATETGNRINSKQAITYAAKFKRLYESLEKDKLVNYIEKMDEKKWSNIRRSEIVEIEATIRISDKFNNFKMIKDIEPTLEILESFGTINKENPRDAEALKFITGINKIIQTDKIPIIFDLKGVEKYKLYGILNEKNLKCDIKNINEPITVIGKVQKILLEADSDEIYNPLSNYKTLINLGEKNNQDSNESLDNVIEVINGPAMKITPLAIYT
jgi:hypothetical protein